jgi:hypothetical protein
MVAIVSLSSSSSFMAKLIVYLFEQDLMLDFDVEILEGSKAIFNHI